MKAAQQIPYQLKDNGSTIDYDYKMLLKFIFNRYGLSEHVMTLRVEVALTLDGAKSSKTVRHVTAGIKLVDSQCMEPLSGECLFTAC